MGKTAKGSSYTNFELSGHCAFHFMRLLYFGSKQSFVSKTHAASDTGNALMQCVLMFSTFANMEQKRPCVYSEWILSMLDIQFS